MTAQALDNSLAGVISGAAGLSVATGALDNAEGGQLGSSGRSYRCSMPGRPG